MEYAPNSMEAAAEKLMRATHKRNAKRRFGCNAADIHLMNIAARTAPLNELCKRFLESRDAEWKSHYKFRIGKPEPLARVDEMSVVDDDDDEGADDAGASDGAARAAQPAPKDREILNVRLSHGGCSLNGFLTYDATWADDWDFQSSVSVKGHDYDGTLCPLWNDLVRHVRQWLPVFMKMYSRIAAESDDQGA